MKKYNWLACPFCGNISERYLPEGQYLWWLESWSCVECNKEFLTYKSDNETDPNDVKG